MENTPAPKMELHKAPMKTRILKYKWFYLLFIPVVVFVIVFYYTPMAGIRFAFTKYNLIRDPVFAGLKNFERLFSMPNFWTAFYNTLELSIVKLLLNTGMAVGISLLLHEMADLKTKKLAQTIIYLPHFLSWVVAASVFQLLLSPTTAGLLNQLLLKLGIIDKSIYFLGKSQWWTPSYYMINIWKDTGWGTVIFMAALSAIDPGIYEAASIDGAGRWKKMLYITLPALATTILTVLILNLARVMNLFESAFVLQNDAVMDKAQVLQTYIYYQTFNSGGIPDYGYTTAVGLFKSLVGMFLVLICNYLSRRVRGRGII
ncbi:MAG: ABC transporter permease subunit [Bacillota bacterium]